MEIFDVEMESSFRLHAVDLKEAVSRVRLLVAHLESKLHQIRGIRMLSNHQISSASTIKQQGLHFEVPPWQYTAPMILIAPPAPLQPFPDMAPFCELANQW